jgi:hypothetical protein
MRTLLRNLLMREAGLLLLLHALLVQTNLALLLLLHQDVLLLRLRPLVVSTGKIL